MVARRTCIKSASLAVLVASTPRIYVRDGLAQQAPNSSGTEPAKLKAPAGACDCHHHIYDADRFPVRPKSFARPETAAAFLATPADFGRQRPHYPMSLAPKPRKVPTAARKRLCAGLVVGLAGLELAAKQLWSQANPQRLSTRRAVTQAPLPQPSRSCDHPDR